MLRVEPLPPSTPTFRPLTSDERSRPSPSSFTPRGPTTSFPVSASPNPRPIAIAPRPVDRELPGRVVYTNSSSPGGFQSINTPGSSELRNPIQTPAREYWTDTEKYDLLYSILVSAGVNTSSIRWDKVAIPGGHTQISAALILQDIAMGKHRMMHPSFTPSNTLPIEPYQRSKSTSKKRKLDHNDEIEAERMERATSTSSGASSSSSSLSPSNEAPDTTSHETSPPANKPVKSRKPRRQRSETPIELDLTNPHITQYLKREGYMNEDGTPAKRKRGRPTKDPFGLSVTLKKKLITLDPSAPPQKKRGRPRKRFLDVDVEFDGSGREETEGEGETEGGKGNISLGLRRAIERIGEELMDKEVEGLLNEGRGMRGVSEESGSYEGSVVESDDDGR
ncbi:hypothetical protein ABW19_dt0209953 [Dactylella cylindrospora]|nr:hypothetical protein ABW19_dt0209953 [Dactylella cylindrospora]